MLQFKRGVLTPVGIYDAYERILWHWLRSRMQKYIALTRTRLPTSVEEVLTELLQCSSLHAMVAELGMIRCDLSCEEAVVMSELPHLLFGPFSGFLHRGYPMFTCSAGSATVSVSFRYNTRIALQLDEADYVVGHFNIPQFSCVSLSVAEFRNPLKRVYLEDRWQLWNAECITEEEDGHVLFIHVDSPL